MAPISALVTGYATDKLVDVAERMVRKHVIERWTRMRAIEFYREFCATLLKAESSQEELQDLLDELLSDETKSEIVFEAYRLVCLAKSKTIGPRIIAVLVAEIVQRDGIADNEEEILLAAAEALSDSEFSDFATAIKELGSPNKWGEFKRVLDKRQIDSNLSNDHVEIGQGSLVDVYGTWAEKLKTIGLVAESVSERTFHYQEDSERHIDMDGSVREIIWTAHFHRPSARLAELVDRVSPESAP